MLKFSVRFAKWAAELRTYHVSYIQRKEAEGQIVKKFFGKGEQVLQTLDMDYEALLTGLVASRLMVNTVEGSRVPRTEKAKRYREEIMDAMAPFHRFWITHLPKALNPKSEALTGLASIGLEFLNQEVSVGVKTRPSMESQDKLLEKIGNAPKKAASGKSSPTWEDYSGSN
ncbi:hypothetical protein Tco_0123269 [Tanacetum coccineum]